MKLLLVLSLLLVSAGPVVAGEPGCRVEPASQWAPAGFVCPPRYGIGTASTWQGPGVAYNGCPHSLRDTTGCPLLRIQSMDTGLVIIVRPTEWCHCWTGVTGPNGETVRIVDLDPRAVAALGLDPSRGLWPVLVAPAPGWSDVTMPDTSTR